MKVKARELADAERIRTLDALYTAASSLRGRKAMKGFLKDMLTESERITCGRRILIARMLLCGEGYDEIQASLKVGTTTIAKVERWLSDQLPGYERAVRGLERSFSRRETRQDVAYLWRSLKRKYPLHFLFFGSWKR